MSWITSRVNRKYAVRHLEEGGEVCVQYNISLSKPFGVTTAEPLDNGKYYYTCDITDEYIFSSADKALREAVFTLTLGDFEDIEGIELHAC